MTRRSAQSIRFFQFFERRYCRARPGSVLIFAVALLVLMALMGTAYISTAQVDRYSAQQNTFNTEIDLLLKAVVQMEQTLIGAASNAPTDSAVGPSYHHWNSPADENWWGSRVPVMMASNQPGWRFVAVSPTGVPFESPYSTNGTPNTYTARENLVATSIPITVNGQTVQYPAFFDSSSNQTYLAASASGDGIADAGLWRVPIGELNGITYYAAVRVFDNNSAIDASVADSRNTLANTMPGDFFPSNVDLQSLLAGGPAELNSLDLYRFNYNQGGVALASLTPIGDNGAPMSFQFTSPYDAMWHQLGRRPDSPGWNMGGMKYQSLSATDAMALAYRFCLTNSSASPSVVEQALQSSLLNTAAHPKFIPTSPYSPDQAAQWYSQNFAYENETAGSSSTYLPRRALMAAHAPVSNFAPDRYTEKGDFVSSLANGKPNQVLWDPSASYTYGDWVHYDNRSYVCIRDTDSNNIDKVNVNPGTDPRNRTDANGNTVMIDLAPLVWAPMPWNDYPTRTGINTASFNQLWLAFWNVMADTQGSVPAGTDTAMFRNPMRSAVTVNTTGSGNPNGPPAPSGGTIAVAPSPGGGDDTATIQAAVNSSPEGSTITFSGTYHISSTLNFPSNRTYTGGPSAAGIAGLTPYETLQLRAALAAANSEQLRVSSLSSGNPYDVISRSISIGGFATPTTISSNGATFTWTGAPGSTPAANLHGDKISVLGINFNGGGIQCTDGSDSLVLEYNSFTGCTNPVFINGLTNATISYNTFTNDGGTGIYTNGRTKIANSHFDYNTFDKTFEPIHMDFGDDGASHDISITYNYLHNVGRYGIELQSVSTSGLKVMYNYVEIDPTISSPGGGLSIATGDDSTIPGPKTSGNEIGFNVCIGGANCGGHLAIENYGSGTNIHDNYINGPFSWGVLYCWTQLDGNVPWYMTNNIFIGCGTMDSAEPFGGGIDGGPIPPTLNGNSSYPQGGGPAAPPPPVISASADTNTTPGADIALNYTISVFGSAPQPYITEVYANNDQSLTQNGYVAVELYNPYNVPIVMNNWRLATISRPAGSVFALTPIPLGSTLDWQTTPPTIQPGGFLRLVSSSTPPSSAQAKPPPPPDSTFTELVVRDLTTSFDQELVLLRPRRADGVLSWMTANPADQASGHYDPSNVYDERTNLADFVPLDSYDFTGLPANGIGANSAEWHYIRPNDPAAGKSWHFVYPGKYMGNSANAVTNPPSPTQPRLVGTVAISPAPQSGTDLSHLGRPDATPLNTAAYTDFPIQVNNTDFMGTKLATFPHGGFARNGDILHVTYIGAYTIKLSSNLSTLEMNPITMDSAFADDAEGTDDTAENIGRFTPIHPADLGLGMNDPTAPFNDYHAAGPLPAPSVLDWSSKWSAYHFATRLFDFLTVQAPHDDYLPNISPTNPDGTTNTMVQPVANADPKIVNALLTNSPANMTEDNVPIEGLININTAPWRVLATLPMSNTPATNAQLAQAIVYYRDVDDGSLGGAPNLHPHGPFQSIWELNAVPGFRTTFSSYAGTYNPATSVPVSADGYFAFYGRTSGASNPTNTYNDFETQNLALTRISNLITTRSDAFTVYVLVQGFRNAATANPELVVQRRAAFIADRSRIIPTNSALTILNVPTN